MKCVVENNGLKASYNDGCTKNSVRIPGVNGLYEALQFHIHLKSEHTIDGRVFGAELHIVHKSTTENRFAVVGMMLEPSAPIDNILFEVYLNKWVNALKDKRSACQMGVQNPLSLGSLPVTDLIIADVYALLQPNSTFYHYDVASPLLLARKWCGGTWRTRLFPSRAVNSTL
jgi:hypothetical protein